MSKEIVAKALRVLDERGIAGWFGVPILHRFLWRLDVYSIPIPLFASFKWLFGVAWGVFFLLWFLVGLFSGDIGLVSTVIGLIGGAATGLFFAWLCRALHRKYDLPEWKELGREGRDTG